MPKRGDKALAGIIFAVASMIGSSLLFYRAEVLRYKKEAELEAENFFGIYPTLGYNIWFVEDYLALILFLLAVGLLIYGVWLRKADTQKSRTEPSKIS